MADKPAAGSKPDYPIPWIATYFLTGLALIVGSFILVWYASQFSSEYDYSDPDMKFLERIVLSPTPRRGDFSALNGGNWQALCLVGWNGDPGKALQAAGIGDAPARVLLEEAERAAARILPSEFSFLYTDNSGRPKALRHPHGFAFAREGQAACTSRAQPVLRIPAGSS